MGNGLIALLIAAGASAYIYSKVHRSTGGNVRTTIIATTFCGVIILFVSWTLLNRFVPK